MTGHAQADEFGVPIMRLTEDGAAELYHYPSRRPALPAAPTSPPHTPTARGVAPVIATPVTTSPADPTPVFNALEKDWKLRHPGLTSPLSAGCRDLPPSAPALGPTAPHVEENDHDDAHAVGHA